MSELNVYGAPKESLTMDEEHSLRENVTSLLNDNNRMCLVTPQGVLNG